MGANRLHTPGGQVQMLTLVAGPRRWGIETGVLSPLRQGVISLLMFVGVLRGLGLETGVFSPLRQGILP